jgi:hypothetical protein
MSEDLQNLEDRRDRLYEKLRSFGDFRLGIISQTYTRCGKTNCACAHKDHPGHGTRYLWNTTRQGKSLAQHLRLGPELDHVYKQIETGHRFQKWCQEAIELNEEICRLRPVAQIEDEKELTALKKKLHRRFSRRPRKKSIA